MTLKEKQIWKKLIGKNWWERLSARDIECFKLTKAAFKEAK